ncbi:MAG: sodium/proton-translocating pyrophosphatase, partial [Actinobacteria bacterium]|nr:sodium/proton-translocating pyrophosphatase [Actinomycetota bacterium]
MPASPPVHVPHGFGERRPLHAVAALVALTALASLGGCAAQGETSAGGKPHGGEATLVLPDLSAVTLAGGVSGRAVLTAGLLVCLLGLGFGVQVFVQLRRLPVHRSMREISELIYATCKQYLLRQGRFLLTLWVFIGAVIVVYYRALVGFTWGRVAVIMAFSLLGMGGSYAVAWFGIRVNTFANSRTAFAALGGKPLPVHRIPMRSGMSIGMVLISLELLMMLT